MRGGLGVRMKRSMSPCSPEYFSIYRHTHIHVYIWRKGPNIEPEEGKDGEIYMEEGTRYRTGGEEDGER